MRYLCFQPPLLQLSCVIHQAPLRCGLREVVDCTCAGMLHINATRKDPRMGPTMLVLAPTRELAVQIKMETDKFGNTSGIRNT